MRTNRPLDRSPEQGADLLLARFGYIFYYVAIVYPLFVILDWHQIPWDRTAAVIIRVSVSLMMLGLAFLCKTEWGRTRRLSLITLGVLLGQAGFAVVAWHAKGLGSSDGDDFSFFFGPFCVLIPASVTWTACVGVAMVAIEVATFALSGTPFTVGMVAWNVLPFFIVFLLARHAANVLEVAWRKESVERTTLEKVVTELRTTQDTLVQAEKMAALGRLTAGVAHELNNPLFVIGTNLTVIEEGVDALPPADASALVIGRMRNGLQRLRSALVRASFVSQVLREFSAPPSRRNDAVDINQVAQLSISLVTMTSKSKGVEIHQEFGQIPKCEGDSQSLSQVLVNLIENACDAVSEQGNVWVTTSLRGDVIEVSVRDDGPGIPSEFLPRLTEPFFTTKEPGKGMGLGLAVANSVVERHGGTIAFSNGDPGAVVTVTLPLRSHTS